VACVMVRKVDRTKFSGGGTLAAACARARWVLTHGWPVVSVHGCFGRARHIGQRTDIMCRSVSFPGSTFISIQYRQLDSCSIVLF
jgi:hypothetical protein